MRAEMRSRQGLREPPAQAHPHIRPQTQAPAAAEGSSSALPRPTEQSAHLDVRVWVVLPL